MLLKEVLFLSCEPQNSQAPEMSDLPGPHRTGQVEHLPKLAPIGASPTGSSLMS